MYAENPIGEEIEPKLTVFLQLLYYAEPIIKVQRGDLVKIIVCTNVLIQQTLSLVWCPVMSCQISEGTTQGVVQLYSLVGCKLILLYIYSCLDGVFK